MSCMEDLIVSHKDIFLNLVFGTYWWHDVYVLLSGVNFKKMVAEHIHGQHVNTLILPIEFASRHGRGD